MAPIELWDATSGALVRTLTATTRVSDLEFAGQGQRLATAHSDGTVRLWDPTSGRLLLLLHVGEAAVDKVHLSDDATTLLTHSEDDTVRVWTLDVDDLVAIARAELTRGPTDDECRRYRLLAGCHAG